MSQGLDVCLDLGAMQPLLQQRLLGVAQKAIQIQALRIDNVRRTSSRQRHPHPMAMRYELALCNDQGFRLGQHAWYAKTFRDGLSAACFERVDRMRLVQPPFGQAIAHVPELDMVLWAWPNDPGLPQLLNLMDGDRASQHLPWQALALDRHEVQGVQVSCIRYQPERRATLRYEITLANERSPRVVYAKTFADERAPIVEARFRQAWQRSQHHDLAPLVAQPLGHDIGMRTLWQGPAEGVPLRIALQRAPTTTVWASLAHALVSLHAMDLPLDRVRSLAHWCEEVRRRQKKLARAKPELATRGAAIVEAIQTEASLWLNQPLTLIHGDFHPEQVWVHEGRLVLFDFDEFALGDPLEDVAEFALKLGRADWERSFIRAASFALGERFSARRLHWHLAVQCVLQASRAFVFQRDNWTACAVQWLVRAEHEVQAMQSNDAT